MSLKCANRTKHSSNKDRPASDYTSLMRYRYTSFCQNLDISQINIDTGINIRYCYNKIAEEKQTKNSRKHFSENQKQKLFSYKCLRDISACHMRITYT